MPKYTEDNWEVERSDFRKTIYWNPVIQTDKNGEASFSYWNSDEETSFRVEAQEWHITDLWGSKPLHIAPNNPLV